METIVVEGGCRSCGLPVEDGTYVYCQPCELDERQAAVERMREQKPTRPPKARPARKRGASRGGALWKGEQPRLFA